MTRRDVARKEKAQKNARYREEPIPALSAALSHTLLAGLLLYSAIPMLTALRHAAPEPREEARLAPGTPARAPTTEAASSSSATPAPEATVEVKEEWSAEEITRAKEQCTNVLASTAADIEMLEPVKKGECGLPAPVLLKSIGSEPKVVFDPPVEVNCAMVAALGRWEKSTLQPKARERFKSPVTRIIGGSGYSCRNIYNLPNAKLSQHALANAVDIGGFEFANGHTIVVLKGWGLTARDLKAKAEAEAKAKAKAGRSKDATAKEAATEKPGSQVTQASLTSLPSKSALRGGKPTLVAATPAAEPAKSSGEAQFLRALHEGACREFGTVLGPEANDPHRNHFHLDLIPRRGHSYCE